MKGNPFSNDRLTELALKTTLGKESEELENTPEPGNGKRNRCFVLLVLAFIIGKIPIGGTVAGVLALAGAGFGCAWLCDKAKQNEKAERYAWILWIFTGVGMVFRCEREDLLAHIRDGKGDQNQNLEALKQTCTEIIALNYNGCCHPNGLSGNWQTMKSIVLLNYALNAFGDKSFLTPASECLTILQKLDGLSINENGLADSDDYGRPRNDYRKLAASITEADIISAIDALETQCRDAHQNPMLLGRIDMEKILTTMYLAAYVSPSVSEETYRRIERLYQIAYGGNEREMETDAMLVHLIRCRQLSMERVNRETGETCKWLQKTLKAYMQRNDFDASRFVCGFCGALKLLGFYAIERACLETAEKSLGVMNAELTARLDYLNNGGAKANAKVKYYGGAKRGDTLPVDYAAAKANASDIEWLFNEARGAGGSGGCMDYGLAFRVQERKAALPSAQIRIQPGSIAKEIGSRLGQQAHISSVRITTLNDSGTVPCLKIRLPQQPNIAYLLDMATDAREVKIRLAACWIPVSQSWDLQLQQCLALWNSGTGAAMACMERIFGAIENDIQRSIDIWKTTNTRAKGPANGQINQNQVLY